MNFRLLFLLVLLAGVVTTHASTTCAVICEGDSLTAGTGSTGGSNYVSQMNLNGLYGNYVTNIGHGGDVISANSAATDALTSLTNTIGYAKQTVVMMMQVNDIAVNDSVPIVTTNMLTWQNNVRAKFPNAKIMWLTSMAANLGTTLNARLVEVNTWLKSGTANIDYVGDLRADPRLQTFSDTTYYDPDGVHLNNAGYLVMATIVRSNLVYFNRVNAEFYVRKDGSDSNTGTANTSGSAWLTIQKGANTATSGDIVYVATGQYDEIVAVNVSSNLTFIGSTATNRGWNVTKSYTQIRTFDCNGTNVSSVEGVLEFGSGSSYSKASNVVIRGFGSATGSALGVNMNIAVTNIYLDRLGLANPNGHAFTLVGQGHTVTNCNIWGTNGWDCFRIVASGCLIVNNMIPVWSNPGDWNPNHTDLFQSFGDNFDIAKSNTISGNIVLNAAGCQLGNVTDDQEVGDISYWNWFNNVFVDVSNTINLYSPGHRFLNNTFVRCGAISAWTIIYGSSTAGHADNTWILNNIFYQCGDPTRANRGWYAGDVVSGLIANYNLVVGTGAGTTKDSSWTEANGINGSDPLFANAGANDYRLATNSPALAAGTNLINFVSTDANGVTRSAPFSMGAFQTAGAGDTTAPVCTILVPSTSINTPNATVDLSGTASDNVGVTTVPPRCRYKFAPNPRADRQSSPLLRTGHCRPPAHTLDRSSRNRPTRSSPSRSRRRNSHWAAWPC